MDLEPGTNIAYRLLPDMNRRDGVVVAWNDKEIRIRIAGDDAVTPAPDRYVLVSEIDTETDYYGLMIAREGDVIVLKRMWTGKRGYFRVNDVFPVICTRVDGSIAGRGARFFPGFGMDMTPGIDMPDETVSPRLWKLLVDINSKLGLILEHLHLETQGLTTARPLPVNISASGIRLVMNGPVTPGDMVEIKMLLPVSPPAGIIAYGVAVRVEAKENDAHEVALHFTDLAQEIQDTIVQYTLNRQREIIRKLRQWEQGE